MRRLGRRPHRQVARGVHFRDDSLRFHECTVLHLARHGVGADDAGFTATLFNITEVPVNLGANVVLVLLVQKRLPFVHGSFAIQNQRQRFKVHLYRAHRIQGNVRIICRNSRNFIPDVTNFIMAEDCLVVTCRAHSIGFDSSVFGGDYSMNSGNPFCFRGIDVDDVRVRQRAVQNCSVEHVGSGHVIGVDSFTDGFVTGINTRGASVQDLVITHCQPPTHVEWLPQSSDTRYNDTGCRKSPHGYSAQLGLGYDAGVRC
ncbi:hypothetical protein BMS3Bbin04_00744 [bacterium BMS3Bbin04]|nr:hypothetical protein BMS3Bbin04_00744 [bacterium BMS3Bbin04]